MDIKFDALGPKDKFFYLLYEFLGSAALVISFNLSITSGTGATILFVVTLVGWNLSSCHFNSGVSLAQLVYEHRSAASIGKNDLIEMMFKICTQFLGGLLGILIIFSTNNIITHNDIEYAHPSDKHICPTSDC